MCTCTFLRSIRARKEHLNNSFVSYTDDMTFNYSVYRFHTSKLIIQSCIIHKLLYNGDHFDSKSVSLPFR